MPAQLDPHTAMPLHSWMPAKQDPLTQLDPRTTSSLHSWIPTRVDPCTAGSPHSWAPAQSHPCTTGSPHSWSPSPPAGPFAFHPLLSPAATRRSGGAGRGLGVGGAMGQWAGPGVRVPAATPGPEAEARGSVPGSVWAVAAVPVPAAVRGRQRRRRRQQRSERRVPRIGTAARARSAAPPHPLHPPDPARPPPPPQVGPGTGSGRAAASRRPHRAGVRGIGCRRGLREEAAGYRRCCRGGGRRDVGAPGNREALGEAKAVAGPVMPGREGGNDDDTTRSPRLPAVAWREELRERCTVTGRGGGGAFSVTGRLGR